MTKIIQFINDHHDVGWLLFGAKAQKRIDDALQCEYQAYHCCHPRLARFIDENIFAGITDINWCG
jgi:hypothetical protein